jgi:hypothetical protein
MSATKTLHFRPAEFDALLQRLGLARLWKAKVGDNLLVICIAPPVDNAAKIFHKERGCCDGSNPSLCFQQREAARIEAEQKEREAKRKIRENPRGEFDGTE